MVIPHRVYLRILSWTDPGDEGCLVSRYSTGSHEYAQIGWVEGGVRVVTLCHLALWRYTRGPIPEGMTVDHTCRNRKCVRLEHLRLLPNLENARRNAPGRDWELGVCAHGHGPEHWRPKTEGLRLKGYCRACRRTAKGLSF